MEPVAVVTALILIQYAVFTALVGWARGKTGIRGPATSGDPLFERCFRVQQNSLEQMAAVIPALWLFAFYVHAGSAALLGVAYLLGRTLYARAYVVDPARRGPGFTIGLLATFILILGGLGGAVLAWVRPG